MILELSYSCLLSTLLLLCSFTSSWHLVLLFQLKTATDNHKSVISFSSGNMSESMIWFMWNLNDMLSKILTLFQIMLIEPSGPTIRGQLCEGCNRSYFFLHSLTWLLIASFVYVKLHSPSLLYHQWNQRTVDVFSVRQRFGVIQLILLFVKVCNLPVVVYSPDVRIVFRTQQAAARRENKHAVHHLLSAKH